MALAVLDDINNEIKRIYIAGSSMAKGDIRIKKYIPVLDKLGEKAPVFTVLSKKLTELIEGDEKLASESLLEAGTLLYSLLYTQLGTGIEEPTNHVNYDKTKLSFKNITYSNYNDVVDTLSPNSNKESLVIENLFEQGKYKDTKLYTKYVNSIGDGNYKISLYIENVIMPAVGDELVPFITDVLDLNGTKKDARLFKILYKILGKDIKPFTEKALEESSEVVLVQAIYSLTESLEYRDTLFEYVEKFKKSDLKQASIFALASMIEKNELPAEDFEKLKNLVLKGLDKSNNSYLHETLVILNDEDINDKIYNILDKNLLCKKETKNKAATSTYSSYKGLINVLIDRATPEDLEFLEKLLLNPKLNFANSTDTINILENIIKKGTEKHFRFVEHIAKEYISIDSKIAKLHLDELIKYRLIVQKELCTKEEVYENLVDIDVSAKNNLYISFSNVYGISEYQKEKDKETLEKYIDRRWAKKALLGNNLYLCYLTIYDDDYETWELLLKKSLEIKDLKKRGSYPENAFAYAMMFNIKDAAKYFIETYSSSEEIQKHFLKYQYLYNRYIINASEDSLKELNEFTEKLEDSKFKIAILKVLKNYIIN